MQNIYRKIMTTYCFILLFSATAAYANEVDVTVYMDPKIRSTEQTLKEALQRAGAIAEDFGYEFTFNNIDAFKELKSHEKKGDDYMVPDLFNLQKEFQSDSAQGSDYAIYFVPVPQAQSSIVALSIPLSCCSVVAINYADGVNLISSSIKNRLGLLGRISPDDVRALSVEVIAQTIVHEFFHTRGLAHELSQNKTPNYIMLPDFDVQFLNFLYVSIIQNKGKPTYVISDVHRKLLSAMSSFHPNQTISPQMKQMIISKFEILKNSEIASQYSEYIKILFGSYAFQMGDTMKLSGNKPEEGIAAMEKVVSYVEFVSDLGFKNEFKSIWGAHTHAILDFIIKGQIRYKTLKTEEIDKCIERLNAVLKANDIK